jgi:hypothetical protein
MSEQNLGVGNQIFLSMWHGGLIFVWRLKEAEDSTYEFGSFLSIQMSC